MATILIIFPNFLIFVPGDFCDAFCVAGVSFGRHCPQMERLKTVTVAQLTVGGKHSVRTGSLLYRSCLRFEMEFGLDVYGSGLP